MKESSYLVVLIIFSFMLSFVYFDYTNNNTCADSTIIDSAIIETVYLEVGYTYCIEPPIFELPENDQYNYFGNYIEENGEKTALGYENIVVYNVNNGSYNLTHGSFRSFDEGQYGVQQKIYLIEYPKNENSIYVKDNRLLYCFEGKEYFVLFDRQGIYLSEDIYGLGIVQEDKIVEAFSSLNVNPKIINGKIYNFIVKDTKPPEISVDFSFVNLKTSKDFMIVPMPSINDNSYIDSSMSYIEIEYSNLYEKGTDRLYLEDIKNAKNSKCFLYDPDTNILMLKLYNSTNYELRYYIYDMAHNVGTKTFKFENNGDIYIEVSNGFIKDKNGNVINKCIQHERIILDLSKISLYNARVDETMLKENMTILLLDSNNNEIPPLNDNNEYQINNAGDFKIVINCINDIGETTEYVMNIEVEENNNNNNIILIITIVSSIIGISVIIILCMYAKKRKSKVIR